jgi:hypothetical protein
MKFALGEINTGPDDEDALPEGYDALTYLQAIYRGELRADPTRMRAANMALPYERPKLSVAVTTNHRGMGNAIDEARAKLEAKRLPPAAEPEPVQSAAGPSFRRIVPAMTGDEASTGPQPRRKPG